MGDSIYSSLFPQVSKTLHISSYKNTVLHIFCQKIKAKTLLNLFFEKTGEVRDVKNIDLVSSVEHGIAVGRTNLCLIFLVSCKHQIIQQHHCLEQWKKIDSIRLSFLIFPQRNLYCIGRKFYFPRILKAIRYHNPWKMLEDKVGDHIPH